MTRVLCLMLVCSSFAWAATTKRPTVPLTTDGKSLGVDVRLGMGKPRDFFEARSRDAACMADLARAKADYKAFQKQIRDLKAKRPVAGPSTPEPKDLNDQIDALGVEQRKQRSKLLAIMEKCGECAVQSVVPLKITTAAKTETWYESDGSCQFPVKDQSVLDTAFKKISDSLTHAKRYPHFSEGGFNSILEFQVANVTKDATTNAITSVAFDKTIDAFPSPQTYLAIWVRGPQIFGTTFAFQYFIASEYKHYSVGSQKEFELKFETVATKEKVKFPDIQDFFPSGRPRPKLKQTELPNVVGAWYLNSDGYVRYYTAAQFEIQIKAAEQAARATLLDTLADLSDRGDWEE